MRYTYETLPYQNDSNMKYLAYNTMEKEEAKEKTSGPLLQNC